MKRFIALLLSFLLIFCVMPSVSAAEEAPTSVMNVLQELGAQNPKVVRQTRSSNLYDNLVDNPATAIEFSNTSYAFLDGNGKIVRIKRVDEIRTRKNVRSASASRFESIDSLKTYIEQNLIGEGYALVDEYHFSEDVLSLRYEKILFSDAVDQYDYVSVRINTSLNELETFYRANSGFQLEKDKSVITEEEAIVAANDILEAGTEITSIRLATVKTNTYFNSSVTKDEIRLAYLISTPSDVVYVDAYTAEVIGGDTYKAVRGGAIGASELTTASASINLAKSTLENMGYTTTTKKLSSQFGLDVPSLLKSAFYSCSHGSATVISSRKNESDENRRFYCADVPDGTYKFVFLDACNTASTQWKNAFNISNSSTNKAFLGWTDTVKTTASYNFCVDFWSYISSSYTVYEAAQDAADNGTGRPIEFTGDTDYNGYY